MLVNLNSIDKVKEFVQITSQFEERIDLISGRYVIDGKSILGIFSLDLTKPIGVHVVGASLNEKIEEKLQKFKV